MTKAFREAQMKEKLERYPKVQAGLGASAALSRFSCATAMHRLPSVLP